MKEEKLRKQMYGNLGHHQSFSKRASNNSFAGSNAVSSTTRSQSRKRTSKKPTSSKITFCDFLKRNKLVDKVQNVRQEENMIRFDDNQIFLTSNYMKTLRKPVLNSNLTNSSFAQKPKHARQNSGTAYTRARISPYRNYSK